MSDAKEMEMITRLKFFQTNMATLINVDDTYLRSCCSLVSGSGPRCWEGCLSTWPGTPYALSTNKPCVLNLFHKSHR